MSIRDCRKSLSQEGARIGAPIGLGFFGLEVWLAAEDGLTLNAAGYAVVGFLYCGAGAAAGGRVGAVVGINW